MSLPSEKCQPWVSAVADKVLDFLAIKFAGHRHGKVTRIHDDVKVEFFRHAARGVELTHNATAFVGIGAPIVGKRHFNVNAWIS